MQNAEAIDNLETALQNTQFSRYFISSSIPYLFNAAFLILLLVRIQYNIYLSWSLIFLPFFLADIWSGVQKLKDLCAPNIPIWHPRKTKATLHLFDCVGQISTKLAIFLFLNGLFCKRVILMCVPLWTCAVCSAYYRCSCSHESEFSMVLGLSYNIVCRGLQPLLIALEIDEHLKQPWMVVFTPTWTILILCFSGALFLAYCAPIIRLHALERLQTQATMLLLMCCVYLLSISCCGFLFVFWGAQRLDFIFGYSTGQRISFVEVLLPMIILQVLLSAIQPAITVQSRRFQLLSQINNLIAETNNVESHNILNPLNEKIWLCRQAGESSNRIYRTTMSAYARLGFRSNEEMLEALVLLAESQTQNSLSAEPSSLLLGASTLELSSLNSFGRGNYRRSYSSFEEVEVESRYKSNLILNKSRSENEIRHQQNNKNNVLKPLSYSALVNGSTENNSDFEIHSLSQRIYRFHADDDSSCIICYTAEADTCFMSCGHGGMCLSCATLLAMRPAKSCPICRGEIKQVLRVDENFFWLKRGVGIFHSVENYEVTSPSAVDNTDSDGGSNNI